MASLSQQDIDMYLVFWEQYVDAHNLVDNWTRNAFGDAVERWLNTRESTGDRDLDTMLLALITGDDGNELSVEEALFTEASDIDEVTKAAAMAGETARMNVLISTLSSLSGINLAPKDGEESDGANNEYGWFLQTLVNEGIVDQSAAAHLASLLEGSKVKGGFAMLGIYIGFALSFMQNIGTIAGGEWYKKQLAIYTPNVPSTSELLKAHLVDPENREAIVQAMQENGLSGEHIDMMLKNNVNVLDTLEIRDLFWRKILTAEQAEDELAKLGFSPDRIAAITKSWYIIPGVQDLLWMVGKEAFEPDLIRHYGLDAEFPADQVEWLEKQGLSQEWAQKYWIAHWTPPSLQMGFEMLHRRVIDEKDMDGLFKMHEIPPWFRDKMSAISYHPYTRVDVRRMYRAGVIDEQEVYETYRDLGYNHERGEKLTEWVKKEYGAETKELTRSQIEKAYADSLVSEAEAIQLLQQLGYSRDQANWFTNNVELQESKRLRDKTVKVIGVQFVNGIIDDVQARRQLNAQGLSAARADVLLLEWDLEKQLDVKLPSKTDLSKMYKKEVITRDLYKRFLLQLGYDDYIAELFIRLDDGES